MRVFFLAMFSAAVLASQQLGNGLHFPARPAFEVTSVTQNTSRAGAWTFSPLSGSTYTATNIPLQLLITIAYRVKRFQLANAPAWISERYNIVGKANGEINPVMIPLMLQTLLEDRFQLRIHWETKELPVYALVLVNAGKLHGAEHCVPTALGVPPLEPQKAPPCGGAWMSPDHLRARKISVQFLADTFSEYTERVILDKTSLTGEYDIDLKWMPDRGKALPVPEGVPLGVVPVTSDVFGPVFFTAIQKQLGLKLESERGPVEMLVIDHVERPSEH